MEVVGELWQQHGFKDLGNWVDGGIAVALFMGLYYYKKWVDHRFKQIMKKLLLLGLLLIGCTKEEDYCEEAYKRYYYDFDKKAAMVETVNLCYYFKNK